MNNVCYYPGTHWIKHIDSSSLLILERATYSCPWANGAEFRNRPTCRVSALRLVNGHSKCWNYRKLAPSKTRELVHFRVGLASDDVATQNVEQFAQLSVQLNSLNHNHVWKTYERWQVFRCNVVHEQHLHSRLEGQTVFLELSFVYSDHFFLHCLECG